MKLVWSRRAVRHLKKIREYIENDNPRAAQAVAVRILEAVGRLAQQPLIGRPGRIAGTRELIIAGTPFVLPYRIRAGKIELIAIFHGRQSWPRKL